MKNQTLTISQLEAFRQESDPVADAVISKIMTSGSGHSISELFEKLITNQDYNSVDLPPEILEYFKLTSKMPEWADEVKIKAGQEVFSEFGPEICLLLMCKALPQAYACKKGALVLHQTGRLTSNGKNDLKRITRRLMETAQFIVNVCTQDGFAPNGSGLITAQKIRLIHGSIRYYIKQSGHWDAQENGVPINQEDMAGTLQSFSSLILEGLEQLGIVLTPSQIEGYFHCWRIAGHYMGVNPKLNPKTYKEGLALGYTILDHQKAESTAGKELTASLIRFVENIIPGNLFDNAPTILIRYFVGDKTADMLGVEHEKGLFSKILPRILKTAFRIEEGIESNNKLYHKIAKRISVNLMQGMLNHYNDYKGIHFYIPPSLKESWTLNVIWEHHKTVSPAVRGYRLAIEKKSSSL